MSGTIVHIHLKYRKSLKGVVLIYLQPACYAFMYICPLLTNMTM